MFQSSAQIPHEEDSLDAEDIFDLEGMDSNNYMASDQDDYDSDGEAFFSNLYSKVIKKYGTLS